MKTLLAAAAFMLLATTAQATSTPEDDAHDWAARFNSIALVEIHRRSQKMAEYCSVGVHACALELYEELEHSIAWMKRNPAPACLAVPVNELARNLEKQRLALRRRSLAQYAQAASDLPDFVRYVTAALRECS